MIRGIIFDMDGLMFDTERICVKAWDYAGEKMGFGKTGYMIMKTLGTNRIMARSIWRNEFGEKFIAEDLDKYTNEFITNYYKNNKVPVKEGLYELLDYLKKNGYKLAVASSSPKDVIIHHLTDAGIKDYFSHIVSGDMVEKSKPEPDIYLKACEYLDIDPTECIALEDSRNGLLAASSAGCKTIMVPDLWEGDEEIDKLLFHKVKVLSEVINLLK